MIKYRISVKQAYEGKLFTVEAYSYLIAEEVAKTVKATLKDFLPLAYLDIHGEKISYYSRPTNLNRALIDLYYKLKAEAGELYAHPVWYKYQVQDYMDLEPSFGYRLFKSEKEAKAWEQQMNDSPCSCTTTLLGPAKREELLEFVLQNDMFNDLPEEGKNNIINPKNYKQL